MKVHTPIQPRYCLDRKMFRKVEKVYRHTHESKTSQFRYVRLHDNSRTIAIQLFLNKKKGECEVNFEDK